MTIDVVKSKIHRVRITGSDLNYIGSITIDENWMDAVDLIENANNEVANSYSQECLAKAKEQSWSTKTSCILNFSEGI